jgi:hypothetical protein
MSGRPEAAPVVIAARPFDADVVRELAARAGAPVVVTRDDAIWAEAGEPTALAALRGIARSAAPVALAGADMAFAWRAEPLAPGALIWTGSSPGAAASQLASRARGRGTFVLGAGIGLALVMFAAALAPMRGSARRPSLPAGERQSLGRYRLVERIAEGGMAEIHTAVSFGTGGFRRAFVIKRLRPEMRRNAEAVAQFIDEANLQAALMHPNIVPVFDFGQADDEYFIAQEYVQGRDVGRLTRRLVERGEPMLPVPAIMAIGHEMLAALEFAHTKTDDAGRALEIVHRDVTPDNVLVSAHGEVKLIDFGIVKAAQGRVTRTEIGLVKGNVDFMSPEQARGRAVDGRSDVFSAALVLYYCATGQLMYPGGTVFDRLVQAAGGLGPGELAKLEALPPQLGGLLKVALATDADDRFRSAEEMRALIAPHVSDGAQLLAEAVERLFGDELRREAEKLGTLVGTSAPTPVADERLAPTA